MHIKAYFNLLVENLASPDRARAAEAARELILDGAKFLPLLTERAQSEPNAALKCQLLDVLGKIGDPEAVPILIALLHHTDAKVRSQACISLGWLRDERAVGKLEQLAQGDDSRQVRAEARRALREIYDLEHPPGVEAGRARPPLPPTFGQLTRSFLASQGSEGLLVLVDNIPRDVRLDLFKLLPKFLALKYEVVPVALDEEGALHLYSARGCLEPETHHRLASLTRRAIVHGTARDGRGEVLNAIERLYSLGLDDYCYFWEDLWPETAEELRAVILAQLDGRAPATLKACAADPGLWGQCRGAHDFLNMLITYFLEEQAPSAVIDYSPQTFDIYSFSADGERVPLPQPPPLLRARIPEAIFFLSHTSPPAPQQRSSGRFFIQREADTHPLPVLVEASDLLGKTRLHLSILY
ncbi:MAG: hypothetical protein Kow0059_11880 [Candidatus Sumerlaeia bacterium]